MLIIELSLFLSTHIAGTDAGKCWKQIGMVLEAARAEFMFWGSLMNPGLASHMNASHK